VPTNLFNKIIMLTVKNVSKEFQSGSGKVIAVSDISLSIPTGSFAAIVGKSGSGKSTLLTLLGGLDRPSKGTIEVDDQEISNLSDRRLIAYRGPHSKSYRSGKRHASDGICW
jgi:putative ABC transport system ATP-binding protein